MSRTYYKVVYDDGRGERRELTERGRPGLWSTHEEAAAAMDRWLSWVCVRDDFKNTRVVRVTETDLP